MRVAISTPFICIVTASSCPGSLAKRRRLVIKDVAVLAGYQGIELDLAANNAGVTLLHCHQQLHMDYGLMALFDYP
jgi:FtsP/CotA-like multicopper oxidase with cupredoxin domain